MKQAITFGRDERGIRMATVGGTDDRLRQELALEAIKECDALTRVLQQSIGKSGFERVVDTIIARINELHSVSMSVLDDDLLRDTQELLDVVFREEWLIDETDQPAEQPADEALAWDELNRDEATASIDDCRADSETETKAGLRFARSMLNAVQAVEGGAPTGPGDDECDPFAYDAMGLEIQKFIAAAALDAKSIDFMYGFTVGLAVYLHPSIQKSTIACDDILTWDPVEAAIWSNLCSPDSPTKFKTDLKASRKAALARKRQAVAA